MPLLPACLPTSLPACLPACSGIRTVKSSGCNHMTCSKCKASWCWLCAKVRGAAPAAVQQKLWLVICAGSLRRGEGSSKLCYRP